MRCIRPKDLISKQCLWCRGVGRSYIPQILSEYSTTAMCSDTLGLLDTLGWQSAHVVGMSMGGALPQVAEPF